VGAARKMRVLFAREPERCLQHAHHLAMIDYFGQAVFSYTYRRLVGTALTCTALEADKPHVVGQEKCYKSVLALHPSGLARHEKTCAAPHCVFFYESVLHPLRGYNKRSPRRERIAEGCIVVEAARGTALEAAQQSGSWHWRLCANVCLLKQYLCICVSFPSVLRTLAHVARGEYVRTLIRKWMAHCTVPFHRGRIRSSILQ
jgi:hypothetical protein